METILNNISKIIEGNPKLLEVLEKINSSSIRYGLYAGSLVAVLTANRVPTDIDILVADDDFAELKRIFPDAVVERDEECAFLYPDKDKNIEFMAFADVFVADSKYKFRLTDLCYKNSALIEGKNFKIRLLNELDTILLKAMLQRGEAEAKHDLSDISDILKVREVNKEYLRERLEEVNPDGRLLKILGDFNLLI